MDILIKEELKIPCKSSEGEFRFLCPICNEFQTAVNPVTNLARCFRCSKNFNTIDLVMQVQMIGFKDSVQCLNNLYKNILKQDVRRKALKNFTAGILLKRL